MKSRMASTPHLSCIFHSWEGAHLAWPDILPLWESELCSWADLPIKNSYIAHQDGYECGPRHFPFILGKMCQCLLMAEVKKESSVSCPVVLVCASEGKRHSWDVSVSGMWARLSPQPLPGYKARFLMWHRPSACLEDGNGHSEETETRRTGVNRWKEFHKICKIEQGWLKQCKIRCSSHNEGFGLLTIE